MMGVSGLTWLGITTFGVHCSCTDAYLGLVIVGSLVKVK